MSAPRRRFSAMRDLPTAIWLLLLLIVSIAHRALPMPGWLMLHLLFLGAITHSILVWSQYFATAVLHRPLTPRGQRWHTIGLASANIGAAVVIVGVLTTVWPLTLLGGVLVAAAALRQMIAFILSRRSALGGQFAGITSFYILAALLFPVGIALGVWAAAPQLANDRVVLAHALINVLGWVGITVAGTLVTLWPTMLRTRATPGSAARAARVLPLLGAGVAVAAIGAATGLFVLLIAGLSGYLVGLLLLGVSLWREASARRPERFSALSVSAALLWWAGIIVMLIVQAAVLWAGGADSAAMRPALGSVVPYLAAGFGAQMLLGALSYLLPVALGGGPAAVRVGNGVYDRWAVGRVVAANLALLVCALPVSSVTRVVASLIYLVAVASFLPLMVIAMRAQHGARREPSDPVAPRTEQAATRTGARPVAQATVGVVVVALAVALTTAIAPSPLGSSVLDAGAVEALAGDAKVQVVQVKATSGMRFEPSVIDVPAGTRLLIELTNTDTTQPHDLVLSNGANGGRLAPGATETIDVGVVTANLDGWCSIIGHRQMGMTLTINAVGAAPGAGDSATGDTSGMHHGGTDPAKGRSLTRADVDLTKTPGPDAALVDASLPPLPPNTGPVRHQITLPVSEFVAEVAPGITQTLWTFGERAPGPVLHGRVGDTFEITLINDGTIGHSIDFHAGALAPDRPMRTIAPGESLSYIFTATRAGIWMYHCSTMPMSAHIASGMFGAVIIEPNDLPEVDRSYVLVQSEQYLGPMGGEVDMDKLSVAAPDLMAFNGYASQYDHAPLQATVGERVRVWVLDAGPNRPSSFHIIGGQFDTVWFEGAYLLNRSPDTGSQALALQPAQGGFIELVFPEAGTYPFVSHLMIDAERGAHGLFKVSEAR